MPETEKQKLLQWIKTKGIVNSVDLRDYGMKNFYLRADRQAREFAMNGYIRRIPTDEAILRGYLKEGRQHIAYWEFNG